MDQKEVLKALRHLKVETGSLACLGCGHENSCSTRGCAVIRAAIEVLEQQGAEVEGMRSAANSLRMHLEKAAQERDALLKEFAGDCGMCLHYEDCAKNHNSCCDGTDWEWRGSQKEEN